MTDRMDSFRQRIEGLIEEFADLFMSDGETIVGPGIVADWAIVAAVDDTGSEANGMSLITRQNSWPYRIKGMLADAAMMVE